VEHGKSELRGDLICCLEIQLRLTFEQVKKSAILGAFAAAIVFIVCQEAASAPIPGIFTYHYDNSRDGQNPNETILTPDNVNSKTFGKVFSRVVDGDVYAEPLYVNSVQVPNLGTRELVYVATEHDSVYAFDASGARSAPVWKVSFIKPRARIKTVLSGQVGTTDISPEIGITGTPVIDPASNTIYVSVETIEKGSYVHRLHALDLSTGQEKFGGPEVITATVTGTGDGSDENGNLNFVAQIANQRGGLTLNNGVVYIPFASHGDNGQYHGWILGYDASTLQQVCAFTATPNGFRGGIWMSGGAPMVDEAGNVFVSSGNGTFDANEDGGLNYGDSLLKLGPTDSSNFGVLDYFTPFDQAALDAMDIDFGASGLIALPDQNVGPPHLLFTGSKEGTLYLLDRDNLGEFQAGDDSQIVQSIMGQTTAVFSTPAYSNGNVYVGGIFDPIDAYQLSNGQLSTEPISASNRTFGFSGATPVVSANGTQNGIVWAIMNLKSAVLFAFDANDLSVELYNSAEKKVRDATTAYVKFTVPTVANGRVFVGSRKRLTAFGLLKAK
jgi:hypothetical protein